MKKTVIGILILQFVFIAAHAQKRNQLLDLSASVGNTNGSGSFSYIYNWQLGKKKKIETGIGARFTSYFGSNNYYITAPAKLTSGTTGPAVLFKENISSNLDSILISRAQVNALNLSINLHYQFAKKLSAGFNIDVTGFSFGAMQNVKYINGAAVVITNAKPTSFNLLLISDNDRGTLNSELFAAYQLNKSWFVKAGYQFLFTEYTTITHVQQFPEPNSRFRNKTGALLLGIRYQLK